MRRFLWVTLTLFACERTPTPQSKPQASAQPIHQQPTPTLQFKRAPANQESVENLVQREHEEASRHGQRLLVYVGATWCEPCQRFHQAVEKGQLEGKLPPIRFLEFDLDQDETRLQSAGYRSRFIPLFAIPNPDGRSSGRQIEGSIKGEGAVAEITPRLEALLKNQESN